MKALLYGCLLLPLLTACQSVGPSAPAVSASADTSELRIHPIFHGSLVLQWQGLNIFIDPYGGAERYRNFPAPDLVLITHPHGDHLHPATLRGLNLDSAELLAPQAVIDRLDSLRFGRITVLSNGANHQHQGVNVEAVPMYNLPRSEDARHPRGWGNGYVLTLGGQRIYISGDTEDIDEMRALADIDIAFVCMNLPYTMTVEQAADAVLEFQPAVVYPYHYRRGDGSFSDVRQFQSLVEGGQTRTQVRLVDWYAPAPGSR